MAKKPKELEIVNIPLSAINVDSESNPRQTFDKAAQDVLTKSIRAGGLMNPLTLRQDADNNYWLVAGERRFRSLCDIHKANLDATIPATVVDCDEKEAAFLRMDENLAREQLSLYETARGCAHIRDQFEIGPTEIARRLSGTQDGGKKISVQHVSNMLRCWDDLCDAVKEQWKDGHPKATFKNLIAVKAVKDPEEQLNEWLYVSGQVPRPGDGENSGAPPEGNGGEEAPPAPVGRRPSAKKLEAALDAIADSQHSDEWKEGATKALMYATGQSARIPGVSVGK